MFHASGCCGGLVGLLQERMRQPLHLGPPEGATHQGAVGNPACGDVLTLSLRIRNDRIEAAGFESMGTAYGLATADVLCDCIQGQTVAEALARGPNCILEQLPDLPQRHRYLARLALDAVRRAVHTPPPREDTAAVDLDGARSFVRRILGNGQGWTTAEVVAMAEAEALEFPGAPARLLATMVQDGVIRSEMDVARKAMVWRLA